MRIQDHFSLAALTADPILYSVICLRSEQGARLSLEEMHILRSTQKNRIAVSRLKCEENKIVWLGGV